MTQQLEQRYLFGDLVRDWRGRRGLTQAALATLVEVSPRHLSFLENGRSAPSRPLVLRLAGHLDVPPRGQNELLLAAGFAPVHTHGNLDDPDLAAVRSAIGKVLAGHEPYPALVVDRAWNLVVANDSLNALVATLPASLRTEPANVLRWSLHPDGLAPDILNFAQWRELVLGRLARQLRSWPDDLAMAELYRELAAYPAPHGGSGPREAEDDYSDVVVPMRLRVDEGDEVLSLFSTVTTFGTPRDITVHELTIEAFYPADERSSELLRSMSRQRRDAEPA